MPEKPNLIYIYDGTFEGFLCCVFESFAHKELPEFIFGENSYQQILGASCREIETVPENSIKIESTIIKKIGRKYPKSLLTAFLNSAEDKDLKIFRYIRLGFKAGSQLENLLSNDIVLEYNKLVKSVETERVRMIEFLRFSEMEGGVFYAEIAPEHDVLPIIMPHFIERFSSMPFIINDKLRKTAALYNTKSWYITSSEDMIKPEYSDQESEYRLMWKKFYDTVAIKERINYKQRMAHAPKKYWKYILEFNIYNENKINSLNIKEIKPNLLTIE